MGSLNGLLPGWHWTYALVIIYGLIAGGLYGVRRRLIQQQAAWRKPAAGSSPAAGDEAFQSLVKARFGAAGAIFFGLALIAMFLGADQDGLLAGKLLDDASIFLLTASLIEMHIFPWSAAALEIGGDLSPYLLDARRKKLTGDWSSPPTIQVVSLDHIRVLGRRVSRRPGAPPEDQRLDLYRYYLGDRAFEQLMGFIERKAHVHLPIRE